ncbi:aldehyde dehydrogenase family protein [Mycobacterium sp. ITM-2016-00317]|uniref:aldehyde dehydrogenase family protein n=1 Tax=Mycobacterium sp. ITM-2016-00317 TaxID=2099694 RepID=UPI00287FD31D|nr:aldehyde dehydrogenase family protein [Mycobacterium sp. ITM-2016-00317]WNG88039.1 aldehyde dehydrogenase family protein [Mycobacterium sp. ITM-2016-00317]
MTETTKSSLIERVPSLERLTRPFIDGDYVDARSSGTFENISPVNGDRLPDVASGDAADIDAAVASARKSFELGDWRRRTPRERKLVLQRFGRILRDNTEELAALLAVEMGKPIKDGRWETDFSATVLEWFGEAVDHLYDEVAPIGEVGHATITRVPVGVAGAIIPWNYPLLMAAVKIAPALASGNSVVLKPAEQTPAIALRVAELALEAGVPAGVLNVVPGLGHTAGKALAEHLDVDAIGFTGSTSVGRLVMKAAAESNLKKVSLELGGKSPALVLADAADMLDLVAAKTAESIFGNAGQMCDSSSRLIIHESLVDEVVDRLGAVAADWQPGDPFDDATTMGAIIEARQLERIMGFIAGAEPGGASIAHGGKQVRQETGGFYVEPTVIRGVTNDMAIARDEIFGPVLSVITFSDDEEGLRIANDTSYGLAAKMWTGDLKKAHRISRELRAGAVLVNGDELFDVTLPHGGFKMSGIGRDYSHHAFDNWTQLKSTYINLL